MSDERTSSESTDAAAPRTRRELRELRERLATEKLAVIPGEVAHDVVDEPAKQPSKPAAKSTAKPEVTGTERKAPEKKPATRRSSSTPSTPKAAASTAAAQQTPAKSTSKSASAKTTGTGAKNPAQASPKKPAAKAATAKATSEAKAPAAKKSTTTHRTAEQAKTETKASSAKATAAKTPAAKATPAKRSTTKAATKQTKAATTRAATSKASKAVATKAAASVAATGKPRFSAAAYASAAAATIADAAARATKQRPSPLETSPNVITAGGVPSARSAGGGYTQKPRADFTASQSGSIVSNKPSFAPPPRPDKAQVARTGSTDIARTTTGSIAKPRLTTSGSIDTITRDNLNPDTAARLDALTGPIELPSERRKKRRRRIGTILLSSLLAVVVVAAALGGWAWWTVTRSFPVVTGTIAVEGLKSSVSVQRDTAGIATITAQSPTDLFFSQGYVHAQDRFWEMDVRRHITSGTLSEMFGESQVETDKFLRSLNWHGVAQEEYELMSPRDRSYYDAYADGVNAYLAEHTGAKASVEYALLGIQGIEYEPEPWEPVDSIAWMKAMAWDLRSNIEEETTRALLAQQVSPEQIVELYPDYPFTTNPPIVAASSPVPESGFVIGSTIESEAPDSASTEPEAPAEPAQSTPAEEPTDQPTEPPVDANAAGTSGAAFAASDESVMTKVDKLLAAYGEGIGSNSWVISGRLTESGKPLLANDPHLGAALPSVWTQLHLRCETLSNACPFDVAGFSFSGLPGIIIGHNQQIAWGFTNLTTDVADLYIERLTDDGQVYLDGATQPVTERTETINVAGGTPVNITVRETSHGPIVSDFESNFAKIAENPYMSVGEASSFASTDSELPAYQTIRDGEGLLGDTLPGEWAVSLRWTALDTGTSPQAIFALNTATNFDEFRSAAQLFNVPAQNLIYADVEGNIGYQAPGNLPIRSRGDGWMPQPGWDSGFDWQGFIAFDDLPVLYNPASGYIVTANNAIIDGAESASLTRDWDYGYRQARIVQLVEQAIAAGKVTPESMAAVQNDNRMWIGPRLANAFKNVSVSSDLQPVIDEFQAWDGQNNADSAQAAYANVLWNRLVLNLFQERDVPLPVTSQSRLFLLVDGLLQDPESSYWQNEKLGVSSMEEMLAKSAEQARDELVSLQGEDRAKWNWGSLHALELTNETLGKSGISVVEWLLNRGPFPVGGGGSVVNATGWTVGDGYGTVTVPSMRMVVDLDNFDNSTWINLTGQSGHTFHANYSDQTADWANGIERPWPFTPDAINQSTAATLTLQPK